MRILLTNDDGINAPGLGVLREIAAELSDDIWIVAPEHDNSGVSHALTLHDPLRCRAVGERQYAVKGTPTDCVIMAVRHVLGDTPPDLVLSGVNRGQNIAEDVIYSGTIAGAMEGAMLGIPSVALSLATGLSTRNTLNWDMARVHGPKTLATLLAAKWPADITLNINFPDCAPDALEGTLMTRQGRRDEGLLNIDERHDTWGRPYYWFDWARRRSDPARETDLWAVYNNRISVTPLKFNLTEDVQLERLKGTFT